MYNLLQEGLQTSPYPESNHGPVVVGSQTGGYSFFANTNIYSTPNWTQLGKNVKNLSYSNGKIFLVTFSNDLYYTPHYGNPSLIQVPAKVTQVSYDGYNHVLMVIGMGNDVFYANENIYHSPNWTKVGDGCKYISYSNQQAYAIGTNDEIYYYPSFTSSNRIRIPGALKQISFDGHKNVVVGVNSNDDIWYAHENTDNTSIRWIQIPGKLRYVSYSDRQIYGTNSANDIYYTRLHHKDGAIQQTWIKIPGNLNCVSFDGVGLKESNHHLPTSDQVVEHVSHIQVLGGTDWLQISQLVVLDEHGQNIAPSGKPTSSGVYLLGNRPTPPFLRNRFASEHNAIDGIQHGRGYPHIYHSSTPRNAWYSVQLSHPTNVTSIVIYNRTDCCSGRLASGYRVRLLDHNKKILFESARLNGSEKQVIELPKRAMHSAMAVHSTPIIASTPVVAASSPIITPYVPPPPVNRSAPIPVNTPPPAPVIVPPPPPPPAPISPQVHRLAGTGTGVGVSYVKISTLNTDDHWLQLSQVVVMDMSGNNIARTAKVTSSGTGWGTNENTAIDGNLQARPYPQIHHSNTPNNAWYMLALQNVSNVGSVTVYNRTDCCHQRMIGTTISLLDAKQNVLFKSEPLIDVPEQTVQVPQIVSPKIEPEKTYTNSVRGCENHNVVLSCPTGQIMTNSIVNYGKWDDDSCGVAPAEPIMKTKQLSSIFNADILNRNKVEVNINNVSFKENPAPYLNKSVEIKYDCAPPSTVPHAHRHLKPATYHYQPPPPK
jgi:hypothetical protein